MDREGGYDFLVDVILAELSFEVEVLLLPNFDLILLLLGVLRVLDWLVVLGKVDLDLGRLGVLAMGDSDDGIESWGDKR